MVKGKEKSEKFDVSIDMRNTYQKDYCMRIVGAPPGSVEATIPKPIIEKEARRIGISIEEFVNTYRVNWAYNSFIGFHGSFIYDEELKKKWEKKRMEIDGKNGDKK